jgi:Flp pilus assembly pilin Flp
MVHARAERGWTMFARWANALRAREDGQTMAEYGVVLSVITLAIVAVFALLSSDIEGAIETARSAIPG